MGTCTSCKTSRTNEPPQSMWDTLQNLIQSYTSMENYIQQQRLTSFQQLLAMVPTSDLHDLCLNPDDVSTMDTLTKDIEVFKRFRRLNRYHFETITYRFMKNIRGCLLQISSIDELNAQYLDELNTYKLAQGTNATPTITKKFETRVQFLNELITRVQTYLDGASQKLANPSAILQADMITTSTASSNLYSIELYSMNTKRLSAYQFPQSPSSTPHHKRTTI